MPARACPYCRTLNSDSERRCHRCGRRLPGPLLQGALELGREALGVEAPVTRLILGFALLVFALCFIVDAGFIARRLAGGDLIGVALTSFRASTLVRFGALGLEVLRSDPEPWRVLSAVFVHVGFLHIAMNLFAFVDLGRMLERAIGGARFAVLFVLSGILGFVTSEIWYGSYGPLTAGASGGVFGQIGAVVGILYARRDPEWRRALFRYLIFAVLLGVLLPVNTPAHLGGFFAGIALGFLLYKEQVRLRLHRTMLALAVLALLSCVASVGLSATSLFWQEVRARELQRE